MAKFDFEIYKSWRPIFSFQLNAMMLTALIFLLWPGLKKGFTISFPWKMVKLFYWGWGFPKFPIHPLSRFEYIIGLREKALELARFSLADFFLAIDADIFLTNPVGYLMTVMMMTMILMKMAITMMMMMMMILSC